VVVRYPNDGSAKKACEHFVRVYLQAQPATTEGGAAAFGVQRIEHGWVGYSLRERTLGVVFDAPGESEARTLLQAIAFGPR
jgi:hypothetical protein